MSGAESIMRLRDLRFAYHRGRTVIGDISAAIEPGKLLALIGPNASGKTTLIKLMLGLLTPDRGQITIDRRPVRHVGLAQRAQWLSYVPNGSTITFTFTVGHVIAMGRYALPWRREAFEQVIDACELCDLIDCPYIELSAGQQQRVLLARALFQSFDGGRVMLLDEPTSAMDLEHVHRAMRLLRHRTERGLAVVAILHDLNLAAAYADTVWLLDRGTLAAEGTWDHVLDPTKLEKVYRTPIRRLNQPLPDHRRPTFLTGLPESGTGAYNGAVKGDRS